jgi:WXG100 family type VII secretion target
MTQGTNADSLEVIQIAGEVDALDSLTQANLVRIRGEADDLRANWQSQRSGKSFDETVRNWDTDVRAMQEAMKDIAKLLRDNAATYVRLDEAGAEATSVQGGQAVRTYPQL